MSIRFIRQLIRSRQNELVELAASLIRMPSVNPSPEFKKQSTEVGSHSSQYLAAKGFSITEHQSSENALITVICDAPLTRVPGPRLLFCGHTDVVPAGDRSRWTFDPFSGEVRSGCTLFRSGCLRHERRFGITNFCSWTAARSFLPLFN